ncbi:WD40-repeat-containing domain protein [Armillaria luteobubalina]|uniref:WD40-repeat-containing domain protein n=1 Tax=Armillaria luteobubalina TaxID=153913 RepID=A0AA39Q868_9AGAR|nr:WD40-repeat-containing domain protein [Armillaria luteobubalina]
MSDSDSDYRLLQTLHGHRNAVNCVLFFQNGELLVSGGDDQCVRCWNISTGKCIQMLMEERWGQVTALSLYEPQPDESGSTVLFVGTGRGTVTAYPLSTGKQTFNAYAGVTADVFVMNDSVESQAVDPLNRRFVVGSHQGSVKMFDIVDDKLSEMPQWNLELDDTPRSIIFYGNISQYIMINTLYDGNSINLEANVPDVSEEPENRKPVRISTRQLQGSTGSTVLSPDGTAMVVHNLRSDKFDVYKPLDAALPILSLSVSEVHEDLFAKGAAFGEPGGRTLVCGGDNGHLHVYTLMGNHVQTLKHKNDWSTIYAVTTTVTQDYYLITSAESLDPPKICIWAKEMDERVKEKSLEREAQATQTFLEAQAAKEAQKVQEAQAAQEAQMLEIATLNRRYAFTLRATLALIAGEPSFFTVGSVAIYGLQWHKWNIVEALHDDNQF